MFAKGRCRAEELDAAVRRFKKAIIERALGRRADATTWAIRRAATKPEDTTNHRNGTGGKTVLTDDGPLAIEVPRDRDGDVSSRG